MSDQQLIEKKINKVTDLIIAVYKAHIKILWIVKESDGVFKPRIVFKNKPQQSFCIVFIVKDTWADIKRKINKLIESDGVCVVCFEEEISDTELCHAKDCKCKIKGATPTQDSLYCFDCCEMICYKCFEKMTKRDCPVCRIPLVEGFKRYYGDE